MSRFFQIVIGVIFQVNLLLAQVPMLQYKVADIYPHSRNAFCQGLVFYKGYFYEGTGLYGKSSVRKVDVKTGKVIKIVKLPGNLFGEGITILDNKLFQLTWKSGIGFIRDINNLETIGSFTYSGEGWGLTNDGNYLIMSDGTSRIKYMDSKSFKVVKTLDVYNNGKKLKLLNELEYINGKIFANVWYSDSIAVISPNTGNVDRWIDFSTLKKRNDKKINVLNGIAYNFSNKKMFVTGKYWDKLFEISLLKK